MRWFIGASALILTLSGCGLARQAEERRAYMSQMEADHQACLNGTTPNACVAYQLDIKKCSPLEGNPYAAGCGN